MERGVFMLHPLTYLNLGFHLPKLRFSYTENRSVQACEGALQGFIFDSSFAHDTCFNAFVLFLVLNLAND